MSSDMNAEIAALETINPPLTEAHRAQLRDWFDTSGKWSTRIANLYRMVERFTDERNAATARLAWERGWVARGNHWGAEDNPYANQDPESGERGGA